MHPWRKPSVWSWPMPSHSTLRTSMPRLAMLMQRICLYGAALPLRSWPLTARLTGALPASLSGSYSRAGIHRPGTASEAPLAIRVAGAAGDVAEPLHLRRGVAPAGGRPAEDHLLQHLAAQ